MFGANIFSKDVKRLRQIIRVLSSHGLVPLLQSLNIKVPFLFRIKSQLNKSASTESIEKRFRLALESLGPTFVKLGQMLSNRPDILPTSFIRELDRLRDEVSPFSFERFLSVLEVELGRPCEEVFSNIEEMPLASGSLAQVHAATLLSGDKVIIKLQRPDVELYVDADLRLLTRLAKYVLWRDRSFQQFQPLEMIRQLGNAIKDELDFKNEMAYARFFEEMFDDNPSVIIPRFYSEFSTLRLNVQQNVPGVPVSKRELLQHSGWDLREHAKTICSAVTTMVLLNRRFHPDLHPGNVLVLSGGRVAFVDFGSIGKLSKKRHQQIISFLEAIMTQNEKLMADVLVEWNRKSGLDYDYLLTISDEFVSRYKNLKLSESAFVSVIADFLKVLRHSEANVPADLILFFKTLMCLDSLLADSLGANFDFLLFVKPYLEPEIAKRASPQQVVSEASDTLSALSSVRDETKRIVKRFNQDLDTGRPFFNIDIPRLEALIHMLDKLTSRMSMAVIAAALVIGSAIITTVDKGELIFGLPAFGFFCFAGACVIGLYVMVSIVRGVKTKTIDDILSSDD